MREFTQTRSTASNENVQGYPEVCDLGEFIIKVKWVLKNFYFLLLDGGLKAHVILGSIAMGN